MKNYLRDGRHMKKINWASNWAKNNVKALKKELEGDHFDAETYYLKASIAKDFVIVHALLNHQFKKLKP